MKASAVRLRRATVCGVSFADGLDRCPRFRLRIHQIHSERRRRFMFRRPGHSSQFAAATHGRLRAVHQPGRGKSVGRLPTSARTLCELARRTSESGSSRDLRRPGFKVRSEVEVNLRLVAKLVRDSRCVTVVSLRLTAGERISFCKFCQINLHDKPLTEILSRLSPDEAVRFCLFLDRIHKNYRMAYSIGSTFFQIRYEPPGVQCTDLLPLLRGDRIIDGCSAEATSNKLTTRVRCTSVVRGHSESSATLALKISETSRGVLPSQPCGGSRYRPAGFGEPACTCRTPS